MQLEIAFVAAAVVVDLIITTIKVKVYKIIQVREKTLQRLHSYLVVRIRSNQ